MNEQGTNILRDLTDTAGRNPLSAALIGMGVLWLFSGKSSSGKMGFGRMSEAAADAMESSNATMRSGIRSAGDMLGSAADTVRSSVSSGIDDTTRFAGQQADTVSDLARSITGSSGEMLGHAHANLSELFRAQPLALGALGLAIGAGIAAALPATQTEAEYLGEASDAAKGFVGEFAADQADRAAKVAGNVLDAVVEEARDQGLTLDDAKTGLGEMGRKFNRVLDAAGKGANVSADQQAAN